jgi:hypothetical protein
MFYKTIEVGARNSMFVAIHMDMHNNKSDNMFGQAGPKDFKHSVEVLLNGHFKTCKHNHGTQDLA